MSVPEGREISYRRTVETLTRRRTFLKEKVATWSRPEIAHWYRREIAALTCALAVLEHLPCWGCGDRTVRLVAWRRILGHTRHLCETCVERSDLNALISPGEGEAHRLDERQ